LPALAYYYTRFGGLFCCPKFEEVPNFIDFCCVENR
jgi:hypothetical protein